MNAILQNAAYEPVPVFRNILEENEYPREFVDWRVHKLTDEAGNESYAVIYYLAEDIDDNTYLACFHFYSKFKQELIELGFDVVSLVGWDAPDDLGVEYA